MRWLHFSIFFILLLCASTASVDYLYAEMSRGQSAGISLPSHVKSPVPTSELVLGEEKSVSKNVPLSQDEIINKSTSQSNPSGANNNQSTAPTYFSAYNDTSSPYSYGLSPQLTRLLLSLSLFCLQIGVFLLVVDSLVLFIKRLAVSVKRIFGRSGSYRYSGGF